MWRQAWMTAQQGGASDFFGTFSLGRTTAGLSLMLCPLQCTEAGVVSVAVTAPAATISFDGGRKRISDDIIMHVQGTQFGLNRKLSQVLCRGNVC